MLQQNNQIIKIYFPSGIEYRVPNIEVCNS